jgi:hypothetical protein
LLLNIAADNNKTIPYYEKNYQSIIPYFLLIGFQSYAQDTNSQDDQYDVGNRQNEIRLDIFDAAFFSAIDVSYERVNDASVRYGASLFLNFRDSNDGG